MSASIAPKNSISEATFQKKVAQWLKSQGCEVYKMTTGSGIPTSTEDLLFLKDGFWGFLECKKSEKAPHQPGQDKTVARHNEMSYSRFCYPENWEEIKVELKEVLR